MDVHFFENKSRLAVVSKNEVLLVGQNGVYRHELQKDFESIDYACFDDKHGRLAFSSKRNICILTLPADDSQLVTEVTTVLERNCSVMSWNHQGDGLYAGDKSGTVWLLPCNASINNNNRDISPVLLCSRIAVILALCQCEYDNNKYLAVGDRDGRISIFHYPATHNLHRVCLGHSQFIASMVIPNPAKYPHYLLSLGGDGLICLWNIVSGACCSRLTLFTEDSFVLSQNRPKSLLLVNSSVTSCKCTKYVWLVFGENSSIIHAFSLTYHYPTCTEKNGAKSSKEDVEFEIKVENLSAVVDAKEFDVPICATVVLPFDKQSTEVVVITGDNGKSQWPWHRMRSVLQKENEPSNLGSLFLEKLKCFSAANNSELTLSLRPARFWLERRPHQHVAEYYAKRKKTAQKVSADSVHSDSSDDDGDSVDG